jgi:hypothetical protein
MPTQCIVCGHDVRNPAELFTYHGRHENCALGFPPLTPKQTADMLADKERSRESREAHLHPPSGLKGPHRKKKAM